MADDDQPAPYSADSITVLEGLEAVRRRPGMFVGSVDAEGVHHLLWEVVANALDEHLAGHAQRVQVCLDGSTATVEDDGRGIPTALHPSGKTALEVVLTTLQAGATADGHTPHVHIAPCLHGVGLAAVNALCEHLHARVHRHGRRFEIACARGQVVSPLRDHGPSDGRGTRIELRPDATLFSDTTFDRALVREHLRRLAYFNPTLRIGLDDESFHEPAGLAAFVREHACARDEATPVIHLCEVARDVRVEVAITFGEPAAPRTHSFVCQRPTKEGGTHVEGLRRGLERGMRAWFQARPALSPVRLDRVPGFVGAVHVGLYDPRFGGPTRDLLADGEARSAVHEVVAHRLPQWLEDHPDHARWLAARIAPS
ncbi:MAG: ATP-binding protein [Myxococcota bacterium]